MTVFRGYIWIIRRNLYTILMYIVIFSAIAVIVQKSVRESSVTENFSSLQMNVAVIDREGGALGETLTALMDREQTLVPIEDDRERIQEELYYGSVAYVLVIPEGAQRMLEELAQGGNVQKTEEALADTVVQSTTAPGTIASFYIETQVHMCLNQIQTCLAAGYSFEDACRCALSFGETSPHVTLQDINGNAGMRPDYNFYFAYMPYAFLGGTIMTLSLVIMEFKKRELRRRMMSSAVSITVQNAAAIAACVVVGMMVWGICILIQVFLYNGGVFRDPNALFYMANSLCCILVALSLGYLSGLLANSPGAVNGINNILSLGLCFLGGIFVPLEMLGSGVQKISRFLPTYWYSVINGILGDYGTITPKLRETILEGYAVQLLSAAAYFGIAMLVRRMQRQEKE